MEFVTEYRLNYPFVFDIQWSFDEISNIEVWFDTQLAIVLQNLKWIKLIGNLIYLFLSDEYHHNKHEYNCYQMEYYLQYHLNYEFVFDIQWSFDKISKIDQLQCFNIQVKTELQGLKWTKLFPKLIYLCTLHQYHHSKPDYHCYQMEYHIQYHLYDIFTLDT